MNLNRENNVMPNAIPNEIPNLIPNILPNRSFNIRYSNSNTNSNSDRELILRPQQPPSSNRMSGGSQNNTDI